MRGFSIKHPAPAMVVACLALGIALGGTSVAAVSQLGRNTVGTQQLRNAAVTNPKLRNSSVTSLKVANRSLLRVDFAPGQIPPGPIGPGGPAGPAGPAGLSGLERVEIAGPSNSATIKSNQIACSAGKRLLGGGARLDGSILDNVAIQHSFPDNDNIYRARAAEVVTNAGNWSLTVFAICGVAA
ncbi:MAG: hypothetical protein H0U46_01530 [Actinobacteria bacterium]|nr:hypothetical protein [Actinomycetota bacterium]